jgi:putative membrane protein insertion efficiency factor
MNNTQQPTPNNQLPVAMRSRNHWILDVPQSVLIVAIRAYQITISPALPFFFGSASGCRFTPTCSQYAMDAIHTRGALAGTALAAKRICRCHPWGGCGHDPVPEKAEDGGRRVETGAVLESAH